MRRKFAFIDVSIETYVITCVECPWWSAIALDLLAAYEVKERHDVQVHGLEPNVASTARRRYKNRHADTA